MQYFTLSGSPFQSCDFIVDIQVHVFTLMVLNINFFFSADEDIDSKYPTNIVVYSSGLCSWVPPGLYISTCSMNIKV